ncbi:DUF3160 domain-containing protein [Anaerovorax sp. IOR16]|uniref:DUF3160 domain-containing protein n=1 Tax=Anaerovorax sp. IOR16 TaxID=2773458 RepID=UPI0019D27592|nr:DUF3160 domain-containing protein [Anaerovorax sp. IOR16]
MKRVIAIVLTLVMLLSLTACKEESPGQSTADSDKGVINNPVDKVGYRAISTEAVFPSTNMFIYDGVANVPEYTVLPGLDNIVNKNQFKYGTNDVGDYYFALQLSDEAANRIEQNGFVVIDSLNHNEYYSQYESNRYDYIPSFITTDSVVHTFHLMYDYVLKDVERSSLMLCLKKLSYNMAKASYQQYLELKGTEFENAAFRNVAFFCVGGKLLDSDFTVKKEVVDLVDKEIALIEAHEGIKKSPLINFGQIFMSPIDYYSVDYSQFIPRGHYTQSEELQDYFKASMWYGQMTLRSAYPDEVRSALLMTSAIQTVENSQDWNTIFQTINFFVGECDDITPVDYTQSLSDIYGDDVASLPVVTDKIKFEQTLEVIKDLPSPTINSIPVYEDTIQPNRDKAITGFRFLGQRFTIDASIFQRLIDRETKYRMLPNALDVPAAFGSDEAYNILKSDYSVDKYPDYDGNLGNVREYISTVKDDVWTSNLYWSWLNMLHPLASNIDRTGYPFFMQNVAWTRKELNTFLGSWTELKHDTLLYAKQPMAERGGGGDEPPLPPDDRGYVEPNPELFGRLALLVSQTRDGLTVANLITDETADALENLYGVANKLTEISQKELAYKKLTSEEYDFIRNYGGELEHIWDAAKKDELEALEAQYGYADKDSYLYEHPDAIVADVATDPNGFILEEATGFAKTIVVAFPRDEGVVLGVGLVYSQYEFTVPIDKRMTDEEWHQALNSNNIPPLSEWKNAFIVQ